MTQSRVSGIIAAAAALAVLASAGSAEAAENCTRDTPDQGLFCIDYSQSLSTTVAGKPFDADISILNTSPTLDSDRGVWARSAGIELTGVNELAPRVTPSAQLPRGLVISGGGRCTDPLFADCGAGRGIVRAKVSGVPGLDGLREGTFGISEILNVGGTGRFGDLARWRIRFTLCFQRGSDPCFPYPIAGSEDVNIWRPPHGSVLPLGNSYTFDNGFGGTGTANLTFEELSLHLDGTSKTLTGGRSSRRRYAIIRMPRRCGRGAAGSSVNSFDGRTVSFSDPIRVTGCTRTSVRAQGRGRRLTVTGRVTPPPPGGTVKVRVRARRARKHTVVRTSTLTLDQAGRFSGSYPRPRGERCKVEAAFRGDPDHARSHGSDRFRC